MSTLLWFALGVNAYTIYIAARLHIRLDKLEQQLGIGAYK